MSASDKGCGGPNGAEPWPSLGTWHCVLLLAALDALSWGLVWGVAPEKLFGRLGMPPRRDSWAWEFFTPSPAMSTPRDAALWHLLALVWLAQAGFLALAAWRPRSLGGLVAVPLIGHALGAVLWSWAIATTYSFPPERLTFPHRAPLWRLAAHDALWLPLLLGFLLLRRPHSVSPHPRPLSPEGRGEMSGGRDSQERGAGVQ